MIVAAAIKHNNKIYSLSQPARHHDIIKHIYEENNKGIVATDEQGFINSKYQFLNRKDAAKDAIKCNQIEKLKYPPNLFSEDLW